MLTYETNVYNDKNWYCDNQLILCISGFFWPSPDFFKAKGNTDLGSEKLTNMVDMKSDPEITGSSSNLDENLEVADQDFDFKEYDQSDNDYFATTSPVVVFSCHLTSTTSSLT